MPIRQTVSVFLVWPSRPPNNPLFTKLQVPRLFRLRFRVVGRPAQRGTTPGQGAAALSLPPRRPAPCSFRKRGSSCITCTTRPPLSSSSCPRIYSAEPRVLTFFPSPLFETFGQLFFPFDYRLRPLFSFQRCAPMDVFDSYERAQLDIDTQYGIICMPIYLFWSHVYSWAVIDLRLGDFCSVFVGLRWIMLL
ncbi:hypothetical protein BS78_03G118000 [Paspalum vaginatum]|nr:hypothetical protein BS78_03G118000 [Paspalum vaginatum]